MLSLIERLYRMLAKRRKPAPKAEYQRSSPGRAHPKNVAGDFYVLDGCCLECGVPTYLAPALFSFDESNERIYGCWVSRQPTNSAEVRKMVDVIQTQDIGCIRYRGNDPAILKSLDEIDEREQCDVNHE